MIGDRARPLVIGIGNPMRRDDGAGAAVVEALRTRGDEVDCDLLLSGGEATALIEAWTGRSLVLVVDAVRSGAAAGALHRVAGTAHRVGTEVIGWSTWRNGPTTHGVGLVEAIALARVLDRLPDRLVVFGIEVADLAHGEGLSCPVAASVPRLVERVAGEIRRSP